MTGYIYTLSERGVPFYIGSTKDLHKRRVSHFYNIQNINELTFEVIDEVSIPKTSCCFLENIEAYWIEQFRQWGFSLVNIMHNVSNNKGSVGGYKQLKHRTVCLNCRSFFKSHHKYKNTVHGKIHINCSEPDSY